MKYGYTVKKNGILYAPGMDVPGDEAAKNDLPTDKAPEVTLTDDVPEGALEDNPDGSVKTYDAEGNFAGFISREEAEKALEDAGEEFEVQKVEVSGEFAEMPENDNEEPQSDAELVQEEADKPKRGRKPKEA